MRLVCLQKLLVQLLYAGKTKGLYVLLPMQAYGMRMIVSSILTNCKVNMRCCIFIIMNDTGVKIGVNPGLRRKLCYLFYINEVVTAYRAENLRHIKALTYK